MIAEFTIYLLLKEFQLLEYLKTQDNWNDLNAAIQMMLIIGIWGQFLI